MLRVSDRVSDNIFKEHFQYTAGFFIYQTGDTLHSTTASETPNGRFGDTLDIVTKDLAMTLGPSFSETFTSFSSARHFLVL
jgi:hypothetical protein